MQPTKTSTRFLALGLLLVLVPFGAAAQDLTLEQVLEKHYEAIGGKAAWAGLQSMKQSGTMLMGPMEAPFTVITSRPNKLRIEFTLQGMTGIQAFNGESGWMVMPFTGSSEPQPLPKEAADQMVSEADIEGVLLNWADKGHTVELLGKEDADGTEAYRIKVDLSSGNRIDYFLDAEYFIPIKTIATGEVQGQEVEVAATMSDFKEVDGLMMPHSIATETPMGAQVMTIESVELNVEVDESLFEMPAPAPQEEPEGSEGR